MPKLSIDSGLGLNTCLLDIFFSNLIVIAAETFFIIIKGRKYIFHFMPEDKLLSTTGVTQALSVHET